MTVKLFCDGSCDYRTQLGGAGVFIQIGEDEEVFINGGFKSTTISRMEGRALYLGLVHLKEKIESGEINSVDSVLVCSDSEYIVKAFTENRLEDWNKNRNKQIPNRDMWVAVLQALADLPNVNVTFRHVRGHGNNLINDFVYGNCVADRLANYKEQKNYLLDIYNN